MNENNLKKNIEPGHDEKMLSGVFGIYKNSIVPSKTLFKKLIMEKLGAVESKVEVAKVSPYQMFISKTSFFGRAMALAVIIFMLSQASLYNKPEKISEVAQVNNLEEEQVNLALARIDTAATEEIKKTPYQEASVLTKSNNEASSKISSSGSAKASKNTKTIENSSKLQIKNNLESIKDGIKSQTNVDVKEPAQEVTGVKVELKSDVETIIDHSYEEKL